MIKKSLLSTGLIAILTGCNFSSYSSPSPTFTPSVSPLTSPTSSVSTIKPYAPESFTINPDIAFDLNNKVKKSNYIESLKKENAKYLYFTNDKQTYYLNAIKDLSFIEVDPFDRSKFDMPSTINLSPYITKAEEKASGFKETVPVKAGYLYALKENFTKDNLTVSFINKYIYIDSMKDDVISFVLLDKECFDSSSTCSSINGNMFFPISKPVAETAKKTDVKFDEILTLESVKFNNYTQICQSLKKQDYYPNFSFKKENDKITIKNDYNWIEKGVACDFCVDTSIIGIDFYDLGKIKLSEINIVPAYSYKPRLTVEEGHSYAIKTHIGYVDFAAQSIKSYVYIDKINSDGISLSLIYNKYDNKVNYLD